MYFQFLLTYFWYFLDKVQCFYVAATLKVLVPVCPSKDFISLDFLKLYYTYDVHKINCFFFYF